MRLASPCCATSSECSRARRGGRSHPALTCSSLSRRRSAADCHDRLEFGVRTLHNTRALESYEFGRIPFRACGRRGQVLISHACCAEACVEAPSACRTGICCKCFAEYEEAEPRTPDAYQHGCCLHSDDGMECEICCSCWGAHRRKRMAFLAKFALSNANATAAPESIKQTMCAVHHASALSRGSARVIDAAHVERGPTRRVA